MSEHLPGEPGESEDEKFLGITQDSLRDLIDALAELRGKRCQRLCRRSGKRAG